MGQAKLRGTFKERRAAAVEKASQGVELAYAINEILDAVLKGKVKPAASRGLIIRRIIKWKRW